MENIKNIFFGKKLFLLTFSLGILVLVGTTIDIKPLQAKTSSVMVAAVSSSSSRPKTAREKAQERRAMLMSQKKKIIETKVEEVIHRPSARVLRTKTAVPDSATSSSARPTVIREKAGCGDGLLILPEACDDGNKVAGDGCSASCTRETGFDCNVYAQPSVCKERCGNGAVSPREKCDDGNTDNDDGCSKNCTLEYGYKCSTASPNVCTEVCGNGLRTTNEACDDGNTTSNDGCSATCTSE